MHLVSCTTTHGDVTDLVNHGMVKNTKTWISWEQNIIFLRNKKILNLCFRWHILRSYCFVAEVTFKLTNCVSRNLVWLISIVNLIFPFNLKDLCIHLACKIYKGVCICGEAYIGETICNVERRWKEYNTPSDKWNPLKTSIAI